MKFLLIMAVVLYFMPKVMRWGIKLFIANQINKVQQDFKSKTNSQTASKEGEIKVDVKPVKSNSEHLKGGEYVDFEEVKN